VHWSVCVCVLHQGVFQDPNQAVYARLLHRWRWLEEECVPWYCLRGCAVVAETVAAALYVRGFLCMCM
jgi:hypothetical protein